MLEYDFSNGERAVLAAMCIYFSADLHEFLDLRVAAFVASGSSPLPEMSGTRAEREPPVFLAWVVSVLFLPLGRKAEGVLL